MARNQTAAYPNFLALEKIGYKSVALKQEIVSKETKEVTADAIVNFVNLR